MHFCHFLSHSRLLYRFEYDSHTLRRLNRTLPVLSVYFGNEIKRNVQYKGNVTPSTYLTFINWNILSRPLTTMMCVTLLSFNIKYGTTKPILTSHNDMTHTMKCNVKWIIYAKFHGERGSFKNRFSTILPLFIGCFSPSRGLFQLSSDVEISDKVATNSPEACQREEIKKSIHECYY